MARLSNHLSFLYLPLGVFLVTALSFSCFNFRDWRSHLLLDALVSSFNRFLVRHVKQTVSFFSVTHVEGLNKY